jgi:hypothetical protein
MTQFTVLRGLTAMLAVGTFTFGAFGAAQSALAETKDKPRHSVIRDHRGPGGVPSGGVTVDGRRVKVTARPTCYGGKACPPTGKRPYPKRAPIVRDHRSVPCIGNLC